MPSMLVYRGDYGQLSLEEHSHPDVGAGEVCVALDTALVCSSDRSPPCAGGVTAALAH